METRWHVARPALRMTPFQGQGDIDAIYQGPRFACPWLLNRAFGAQAANKDTNARLGHYSVFKLLANLYNAR